MYEEKECCPHMAKMLKIAQCKICICEHLLAPVAFVAARAYIGRVFWRSGQTKIGNPDTTVALFEDEYVANWTENAKDVFGMDLSWTVPSATAATYAELGLPVLLVLGIASRSAAFALLLMTIVIEVFVYPGTSEHYYWMLILAMIVTAGPGKISVDHLVRKKLLGGNKNCHAKSSE